jgi:hypothetical protein
MSAESPIDHQLGSTSGPSDATALHVIQDPTSARRGQQPFSLTKEQVVYLEHVFQPGRYPTIAEIRNISEALGMQERHTRIWFQNRYGIIPFLVRLNNLWVYRHAKAESHELKNKSRSSSAQSSPDERHSQNGEFNDDSYCSYPILVESFISLMFSCSRYGVSTTALVSMGFPLISSRPFHLSVMIPLPFPILEPDTPIFPEIPICPVRRATFNLIRFRHRTTRCHPRRL